MRVVLGLLIWSLAEISAFVVVGGWIGLAWVLMLVLGSGVAGVLILRRQGATLARLRGGRDGLAAAGAAGLLGLAAVLLILPGLITDVAGLLLLVPWVRRWVTARIGRRMVVVGPSGMGEVVEARAVEVAANEGREPSGWTRP
jgi:UPF0716 protein FxsA